MSKCKHETDGNTYTSNPPQLKCKKCSEFYGAQALLPNGGSIDAGGEFNDLPPVELTNQPNTTPIKDIDKWLWLFLMEVGAEYRADKPRHATRYDEAKATIQTYIDNKIEESIELAKTEVNKYSIHQPKGRPLGTVARRNLMKRLDRIKSNQSKGGVK